MVRSSVEVQDVTEGEEEKPSDPHPSGEETPQSKSIEDALYEWDESKTSGDSDTDELGWAVPPLLQSLVLCAVEKCLEVPNSYRLYATKWPVEVDLEEAVQDLSYH